MTAVSLSFDLYARGMSLCAGSIVLARKKACSAEAVESYKKITNASWLIVALCRAHEARRKTEEKQWP